MRIHESYEIHVSYCGGRTITGLLDRIRKNTNPPNFVDQRLTDVNFPQGLKGVKTSKIFIVSFDRWISHREDTEACLHQEGFLVVNAAELLSLRAEKPKLEFGHPIVAPRNPWKDPRGYRFVPCIHSGSGNGIRLRMINAGWAPFWRFAVQKAENE